MLRRFFLVCGIFASLVYVATDILAAVRYPDYHSFRARVISELMASGAPTERLVDPLMVFYGALMLVFSVGVWLSDSRRRVRITAGLLFVYAALGFLGPTVFEMDVRHTGVASTADVLHIALTMVMVVFILASVAAGASIRGRVFRVYSFATMVVMLVFGGLTSLASRAFETGDPTPWIGALERINIGAFLLWVAVLAASLLREPVPTDAGVPRGRRRGLPPLAASPS